MIIDELRNHWADAVLSRLQETREFMQHPVVQQIIQGVDVKTIMANCGVSNTTVHHYKNKMLRVALHMINPVYPDRPTVFSNNFCDYALTIRAIDTLKDKLNVHSVITLSHIPIEVIDNLKIPRTTKDEILKLRRSLPDNLVSVSDMESYREYELARINANVK